MYCILHCLTIIFASQYSKTNKMKKTITTVLILAISIAPFHWLFGQTGNTKNIGTVIPLKKAEGNWMPCVQLPAVTITSEITNANEGAPQIVIITSENRNKLFPAVAWEKQFIASVQLPPIEITSSRRKVSLASVFNLDWLLKE